MGSNRPVLRLESTTSVLQSAHNPPAGRLSEIAWPVHTLHTSNRSLRSLYSSSWATCSRPAAGGGTRAGLPASRCGACDPALPAWTDMDQHNDELK